MLTKKYIIDDFYEWNEMKHIWPQKWKSKWKIYDRFGSAFDFEKLLPGKPNSIEINEPSSIETKASHMPDMLCSAVVCCVVMGERSEFCDQWNVVKPPNDDNNWFVHSTFVWHIFHFESLELYRHHREFIRRKIKLSNGTLDSNIFYFSFFFLL